MAGAGGGGGTRAALMGELLSQAGGGAWGLLLSAGLAMGLAHALEPDHVMAVAAAGSGRQAGGGGGGGDGADPERRRPAPLRVGKVLSRGSLLGALWGAGHTSMILLVSAAVFALSLSVPDAVFEGLEAAVGLMLVVLGVSACTGTGLLGIWRRRRGGRTRPPLGGDGEGMVHSHPHSHGGGGGMVHSHPHSHGGGGGGSHRHGHKSYLIGCIHGLAGSGALIALSAPATASMQAAMALALVFGAGSIAGMMLAGGTLSLPIAFAARFGWAQRAMRVGIGAVSIAIGAVIVLDVALGAL